MIGLGGGRKVSAGAPKAVLTASALRQMYAIKAEVGELPGGRLNVVPMKPD
jgi:ABC-type hemin transport system ATPase subunit